MSREIQPCFDKIVLLQNILAIISWPLLAWTLSRVINNPIIKIAGVTLILAFAYTPQIAEWDYILSPESLTFSLFTITLSLLLEIIFQTNRQENLFNSKYAITLIAICMIVFILWVFVRDVHLYTILIAIALLLPIIFLRKSKQKEVLIIMTILVGVFILGYKSMKDSLRSTYMPLENSFQTYIFPYPKRIEYMEKFAMPNRESERFQIWFDKRATTAYGVFLITHPGFVISTLWENVFYFESDFEQPYFKTQDIRWRDISLIIGRVLHPETIAIYLIDVLILVSLFVKAIEKREQKLVMLTGLATFIFFSATITLPLSFFGDSIGMRRHIFPSVEMFRLFLWVFILPHLDTPILNMTGISKKLNPS